MSKRKIMVGVSVLAVTFATAVLRAEEPPATTPTNVVRVGTYDSRAIAIAFYRSPSFTNWLADLKAKHEKAKAEGNQKRVAEFEVEGKASQQLAHKIILKICKGLFWHQLHLELKRVHWSWL